MRELPDIPKVVKECADRNRINVNDPGLITLVNKLQDVFTTVGVRITSGGILNLEAD